MSQKIERRRRGRSLLAALLFLLPASRSWAISEEVDPDESMSARMGGLEETVEGVRRFLKQLTLDEQALVEIDTALQRLDSDSFAERYLASVYLARLPVLPRARLEKAGDGASFDKRLRISQVFKVNTSERTDSMIVRAMDAVRRHQLRGLYPEVVNAIEGRDLERAWDACVGACEVTAVEADLELIERSLKSGSVIVRAGAAAALIKVRGNAAVEQIVPLVEDPDDRIKLLAAHYLRGRANPACLKAYAALLFADSDFAVRWESLDALQQITDQDFGYYASADKNAREGPAKLWMKWVEENAQTAKLNFDVKVVEEIMLFNGRDLEGWKEVKGFFRKVQDEPNGWGVEDGNLVCFGGTAGHLRVKEAFENYHLKFEYRTPGGIGDSGLGLFLSGEDKVKPTCLEVQILAGHSGDLYQIGGFEAMDSDGEPIAFRAERVEEPDEDADGWNRMEVKVIEGILEVMVNGKRVNRASGCPEGATMFTLRNEGSRVEFRGFVLVPLD